MHDLIIIGAGSAGLTAALYAARFKLDVLIFEKLSPGGQILLSPSIENYPGFPGGVSTFELIDKFRQQVEGLGLAIKDEEALEIIPDGKYYQVKTRSADFKTKAVIVATGAKPKKINVKGETEFRGRGVSYCGTCDGPLFKDKDIVIVGAGDRAFEDAIFLSGYAKSIHLIHRRAEFRAAGILVDKAKKIPKIDFVLESAVEEITGKDKVAAVKVKNIKTLESSVIRCQGVFIFAGITPDTQWVRNILETDAFGFIITDQQMLTSKPGIFACGDCIKKGLYQVVSSCGDGATAADSAHKYLLKL